MKSFSSLVDRIKNVLNEDIYVKNAVVESVLEFSGGVIKEDQFSLKEGVLTINASPALKNEIRLKEDLIRKAIQAKANRNITKIQYN